MTALKDHQPAEPEVLIEEARRRQRRRRAGIAAVLTVLATAGAVYGLTAGGGPPAGTRPAHRAPHSGDAAAPSLQSLTVQAGYIQSGADVTSVIRYHGALYAAGEFFGTAQLSGPGCRRSCNPVVWVDRGGHWRVAYSVNARGSTPGETLQSVDGRLLLFQASMGDALWLTDNGRRWQRVTLPPAMEALGVQTAASNGKRIVVSLFNRFAGGRDTAYGEDDPVWTSTDGVHWSEDTVSDDAFWSTVDTTGDGDFIAAGKDQRTSRELVWMSTNGITWSVRPASRSTSALARLAPANAPGVLYVAAVPAGFMTLEEQPDGRLGWSGGGRAPTRVWGPDPYSSDYFPSGIGVDGNTVLVIEHQSHREGSVPAGATTLWRLDLRRTRTASGSS